MMWWALWCAVVVAGGAGVAAAPAPDSLTPLDMVQMDSSAPDDESLYAMSPLAARYSAGAPWLYLLADMPRDSQVATRGVEKRARAFLSVNPAFDVLQQGAYQKLLSQYNKNIINKIGKRGSWQSQN
ncbi:diuretic hormone 41 isoform X3 [Spodoptera frugiperda]|uniref:Diuretic hormone 41 isoform X3 n=2 Tax=Spodoptera frugiperda TaxID=7108 RepID=A0A9R0CVB5_SPOFR|nr:diuretic hormone 41 isoform X3 [Spodoptera frugiperda]